MVEDHLKSYLKKGVFVFFDLNGSKVPFQVTGTENNAHFVVSLENITNKKESDRLSSLEIWVPIDSIKQRHQRSPKNLKDKWEEYSITDALTGSVFKVLRVEEFPQQLMAIVTHHDKEILIPLSDQLITEIDKENKMISMQIPEGLLDL